MAATAPPLPPRAGRERGRRGPRRLAAGQVVIIGVIAYGLATLLNSSTLLKMAERQRLGSWQRSFYVDVTRPVHDLAHALALDRPHQAIDDYRGKGPGSSHATVTSVALVHPPSSVPGSSVPSGPTTTAVGAVAGATTLAPAPTVPATVRPPTSGAPLRLWIGGDSEAQGLGQALEALTSRLGDVDATLEYKVSSGLSRPDYYDWPAKLADVVAAKPPPEVMVVIFGGNDAQPLQLADGKIYDVPDQQWQDEYRRRVGAAMDLMGAGGRKVIWVGPPNAKSAQFTGRLAVLSGIYAAEAAKRPGTVTFLDTRTLLSDPSGNYTAYLPDGNGNQIRMRAGDGFHLSIAGSNKVARAVLDRLSALVPGLGSH
jgi:hypothetical protein